MKKPGSFFSRLFFMVAVFALALWASAQVKDK